MNLVDASVALKWLFKEDYSNKALALAGEAVSASEPIVVPPLLHAEVTNNIYQRVRRAEIDGDAASQQLQIFSRFAIVTLSPPYLQREALRVAMVYALSAAYDAQYVALAEMIGGTLWTDDRRLLRELKARLPFVRPIEQYDLGDGDG